MRKGWRNVRMRAQTSPSVTRILTRTSHNGLLHFNYNMQVTARRGAACCALRATGWRRPFFTEPALSLDGSARRKPPPRLLRKGGSIYVEGALPACEPSRLRPLISRSNPRSAGIAPRSLSIPAARSILFERQSQLPAPRAPEKSGAAAPQILLSSVPVHSVPRAPKIVSCPQFPPSPAHFLPSPGKFSRHPAERARPCLRPEIRTAAQRCAYPAASGPDDVVRVRRLPFRWPK